MLPNLYPADELAMIRAHKRRLEDRERQLREGYLSGRLNPVGYEATVELKTTRQRVLRKDRLPDVIKNDPSYWDDRVVTSVVLRKIGTRGPIPQGAADPDRSAWGRGDRGS
ncbi:hypothetical protein [Pseudooctadecabacter sp.]|uniref:hypothetical protein n=1 Tax=Pseudooctadecabacter sp. TaxID=1966338 RepID=UPI0025F0C81F|nr:hypothetical protein [Pseudooctadecabacter sp.]